MFPAAHLPGRKHIKKTRKKKRDPRNREKGTEKQIPSSLVALLTTTLERERPVGPRNPRDGEEWTEIPPSPVALLRTTLARERPMAPHPVLNLQRFAVRKMRAS